MKTLFNKLEESKKPNFKKLEKLFYLYSLKYPDQETKFERLGNIKCEYIMGCIRNYRTVYLIIAKNDDNSISKQNLINLLHKKTKNGEKYTVHSAKFEDLYNSSKNKFYQLFLNCCFKYSDFKNGNLYDYYINDRFYKLNTWEKDKRRAIVDQVCLAEDMCLNVSTHYFTQFNTLPDKNKKSNCYKYVFKDVQDYFLCVEADDEQLSDSYIKKAPYNKPPKYAFLNAKDNTALKKSKVGVFYDIFTKFCETFNEFIYLSQQEINVEPVFSNFGKGDTKYADILVKEFDNKTIYYTFLDFSFSSFFQELKECTLKINGVKNHLFFLFFFFLLSIFSL